MISGDTICAIATPPGEGAIGVVRLSGPAALSLLRRAVKRRGRIETRRLYLLRLTAGGEQVLAWYMAAPRSYTGEDVVEVCAHGGRLNMRRVLELFVALGARQAEPGEFTRRAFVNGRLDLTQAEAVAEVIAARGERALRNAHALLGGELGRRVRRLRQEVVALTAQLEACIDFADEPEVSQPELEALLAEHGEVEARVRDLAATYEHGRLLGGVEVALVGAVNAGKSSLLNRLLGAGRALVSEEPGTTRDYLEAEVQWEGVAVTLVDTAGLRGADSVAAIERAGQAMGAARVQQCDVVVEVVDLAAGEADEDDWPASAEAAQVVAANKIDLLQPGKREKRLRALRERRAAASAVIGVSALRGEGLPALRQAVIAAALPPRQHGGAADETLQVTSARHHRALLAAAAGLGAAREALQRQEAPELVVEHARTALEAFAEITGERFTEDVLGAVFSRFCVGK